MTHPKSKLAAVEHMQALLANEAEHGKDIPVCAGCYHPKVATDNIPWLLTELHASLTREFEGETDAPPQRVAEAAMAALVKRFASTQTENANGEHSLVLAFGQAAAGIIRASHRDADAGDVEALASAQTWAERVLHQPWSPDSSKEGGT